MRLPNLDRRRLLGSLAAGAAFVSLVPSARGQTRQIIVQYDWLMSNGQIGDVVAQVNGYFAEAGLEVELMPGGPNSTTVPPVTANQALVGQFSDSGQGMLARSAGAPIKMIAAGFRQSPFAYFSLPAKPIRSVEDMRGKRIGTQPTARFVLDALLDKAGIDPSELEIVQVGWDMGPLANGQVDAITAWVTNTNALSILGDDRIALMQWDAGLPSYANVYFTSEQALAEDADTIAAFIGAVARGWGWMYENRAASVDLLVDAYDQLDRAIEQATVETIVALSFDAATKEHGWGTFDPQVIADQIALYEKIGQFTGEVPTVEGFTTMAILDATEAERPKLG